MSKVFFDPDPLSFAIDYCSQNIWLNDYRIIWSGLKKLALLWMLFEVIFFVLITFLVWPSLQRFTITQRCDRDPLKLMLKILDVADSLSNTSFTKFCEGYFRGAKIEDIYLENFRSLLAWSMFNVKSSDLQPHEKDKVNIFLEEIERRYNIQLQPGFNPNVQHIMMTLEPVPFLHRPLLVYVLTGVCEIVSNFWLLRLRGFQSYELRGVKYWHRLAPPGCSSRTPLLLLHGICSGWSTYYDLACALGSERPIIMVELDAIKINSLSFTMPTTEYFSDAIASILKRHSYEQASVVGHSFGSITAGWFVRAHPDMVSHLTLIDPVAVLLSLPDVAYNFLYRKPATLMEWAIHLAVARELSISHTLRRNFWWYNNVLDLVDDVPPHVGIVMAVSGGDEVLNAAALHEYGLQCQQHRAELIHQQLQLQPNGTKALPAIVPIIWDKFSHGQALVTSQVQRELAVTIQLNEKQGAQWKQI